MVYKVCEGTSFIKELAFSICTFATVGQSGSVKGMKPLALENTPQDWKSCSRKGFPVQIRAVALYIPEVICINSSFLCCKMFLVIHTAEYHLCFTGGYCGMRQCSRASDPSHEVASTPSVCIRWWSRAIDNNKGVCMT